MSGQRRRTSLTSAAAGCHQQYGPFESGAPNGRAPPLVTSSPVTSGADSFFYSFCSSARAKGRAEQEKGSITLSCRGSIKADGKHFLFSEHLGSAEFVSMRCLVSSRHLLSSVSTVSIRPPLRGRVRDDEKRQGHGLWPLGLVGSGCTKIGPTLLTGDNARPSHRKCFGRPAVCRCQLSPSLLF